MKFSAILRVAKIIQWATGEDKDKCVKWREDDQFACIIGYDDLLNIEDEIRTAYEMGVIDGREYLDCPVDEVAAIVDGEQYPTTAEDRDWIKFIKEKGA